MSELDRAGELVEIQDRLVRQTERGLRRLMNSGRGIRSRKFKRRHRLYTRQCEKLVDAMFTYYQHCHARLAQEAHVHVSPRGVEV